MGLTITDFSPACISNIRTEGMLYGITIRSHKSRGRLLHIRTPELPEKYYLITAQDLAARNTVTIWGCEIPLLASTEAHFLGEPVALLVGPDWQTITDLAEQTQVTFEELEPQFEREDEATRHIILERSECWGDLDAVLKDCEQTIEGVYRTGLQDHHYLEPMGALAEPTEKGLRIYSPCTHIFLVRETAAAVTGINKRDIIVEGCFPGDDLDGKLWYPAVIAAQAAAAATIIGQPVRILHNHHEDSLYSPKRAPTTIQITTTSDEECNPQAMQAVVDIDMGSYPVGAEQIIERIIQQLSFSYRFAAVNIRVRVMCTNTPPLGFFDGWGDASAAFAIETHLNRLSEVALSDPASIRRTLRLTNGERQLNGETHHTGGEALRAFESVIAASDFLRKHAAYELQRKRRGTDDLQADVWRGIGLAQISTAACLIDERQHTPAATAGIRLESNGTATILTSMYPGSAGAELAWRSVVCEVLGLPLSHTRVEQPSTATCPDSGPETLSRGITICSRILESCAQAINKRRFRDPLPIEIHRRFKISRNSGNYSAGAAVVEVEIEQHTLNIAIRGIWLAADGGRIIQPSAAIQRLEQGIYSALGFLHTEVLELHQGVLSPSHTIGYRIPRFGEVPDPHIQLIQPDRKGAAVGIGEIPGMCIPAAGIQAVSQASGVYYDQVPITPEIMYQYRALSDTTEMTDLEGTQ